MTGCIQCQRWKGNHPLLPSLHSRRGITGPEKSRDLVKVAGGPNQQQFLFLGASLLLFPPHSHLEAFLGRGQLLISSSSPTDGFALPSDLFFLQQPGDTVALFGGWVAQKVSLYAAEPLLLSEKLVGGPEGPRCLQTRGSQANSTQS